MLCLCRKDTLLRYNFSYILQIIAQNLFGTGERSMVQIVHAGELIMSLIFVNKLPDFNVAFLSLPHVLLTCTMISQKDVTKTE